MADGPLIDARKTEGFPAEFSSARLLAAVLEGSPDCIKLVSAEGRLTYASPAARCLLERQDLETMIGKPWVSLWPEENQPRVLAAMEEARKGRRDRFHGWAPTAAGRMRYWDVTVIPVEDDGGVPAFVVISRDVTDWASPATEAVARTGPAPPQGHAAVHEEARLEALMDLGVLDTEPDDELDGIARGAAEFFGVGTALVSLVDENRQWFKARHRCDMQETPRDIAFCDHAIRHPGEVMVVEDAERDPRFEGNPLVTDGGIRFYAGAPLITREGYAVGTLCLLGEERRIFTERERDALKLFASNAMSRIELLAQDADLARSQIALRELKHRMSNTYAQISSLVSLSANGAEDKAALAEMLRERIGILARAQAHILAGDFGSGDLRGLVEEITASVEGVRTQLPADVGLNEEETFTLALGISELIANARKHGALAGGGGSVAISGSADSEVELVWTETFPPRDGTAALGGQGTGFGRRVLEQIVPRRLKGEASLTVEEGSVSYRLAFPRDRSEGDDD